ncbi:MAG: hypothetical protein JNG90_09755 [Planctomycetaceae bacterium]|nr:hypothetical protein [Planctomycetaceae bacterium]
MGLIAQQAMLALSLAYVLFGVITLAAMLRSVDLADEPDQGITIECIVLVIALWPLFAAKLPYKAALAACAAARPLTAKVTPALLGARRSLVEQLAATETTQPAPHAQLARQSLTRA